MRGFLQKSFFRRCKNRAQQHFGKTDNFVMWQVLKGVFEHMFDKTKYKRNENRISLDICLISLVLSLGERLRKGWKWLATIRLLAKYRPRVLPYLIDRLRKVLRHDQSRVVLHKFGCACRNVVDTNRFIFQVKYSSTCNLF